MDTLANPKEQGKKSSDEESKDPDSSIVEELLVAVQRDVINERTDVLLEAGLNPAIIVIDVFALMNATRLNKDLTTMGYTALNDLGDSLPTTKN